MQENISENTKFNFFKTKNYWRNLDKQIFISFVSLFILGLFFSFSSTSFIADERLNKDYYFFFQKHLLYALLSFFLMIAISLFNTNLLNKILLPAFLLFLITMILVPFFGIEVKGAKRWLNLYIFRFQPTEFIKPFFILIVAQIISSHWIKNLNLSYFLSLFMLSIIIFLLVLQPDLGQSVLLVCTWISIIFISGFNIYLLFLMFGFISLILSTLVYFIPERFDYIISRITSFLDPEKSGNFQATRATEAIKEGSLKGQGMGEGILKESVPEAHTDYVIAVISEEFGSIISILIISIFLFIAFRVIRRIINLNNNFYKLALTGLISLLLFQTFIHVGVNANLLPTTGMTLPFLSYGGSSLLSSGILAGIILNYTSSTLRN
tara:strand:+ start:10396 stop:11535 length:1140 start_codon:yes stop_codon:yes gene_type:complete